MKKNNILVVEEGEHIVIAYNGAILVQPKDKYKGMTTNEIKKDFLQRRKVSRRG